jgi:hypothetical protein
MIAAFWNSRTTGLGLKKRILDVDSGDIAPSDGAGGVDSRSSHPTGAARTA